VRLREGERRRQVIARGFEAWWMAGVVACLAGAGGCSRDIIVGSNAGGGASSSSSGGAGGQGAGVTGHGCPDVGLPVAGLLAGVVGHVDGKNVRVDIEPRNGAADYRVFVLPKAADVSGPSVRDATYRCAGDYEVPSPAREDATTPPDPAFRTRVDSVVQGFARTTADATLGYVFTAPGSKRVPVYALGDPTRGTKGGGTNADNVDCYFMRWPESRVKKYTTSDAERAALLAAHFRDDGIAFYAPESGAAGTRALSEIPPTVDFDGPLYVSAGAELDARKAGGATLTPAFSVLAMSEAGATPLKRVHYDAVCGRGHDELVAGEPRYQKALAQGSQPIAALHWSDLAGATTLVVEALDRSCPYQGLLSPVARPARSESGVDYPAFLTLAEMRVASPAGEVFVNGQGPSGTPRALARACLDVAPAEPPPATWRFDGADEVFGPETMTTFQSWDVESPTFYAELVSVGTKEWALGTVLGELRVDWADWGAGSTGLLRMTAKPSAKIAADSFLHVTMEVDAVSTGRRYPQLLISDRTIPVQTQLGDGTTIVFQTRGGDTSPIVGELELCDHQAWDPGAHCPAWPLYVLSGGGGDFLSPEPEINGLTGVDRTIFFDVFASTAKVYLFMNGLPYACVELPANVFPAGPVTVTFGDVLFVSGNDLAVGWYPFHAAHLPNVTTRHFSNLSFDDGAAAPIWDDARIPCVPASALQ
jgi:hypothetical protein